ncbi:hypothetical protein GR157_16995 [Burkholderia sp. 4701]|nr:hypothetical protein [Burkholderia sp. 4701]MXN83530.1 hypothetical protein [Burkholderia sp. 4812]
MKGMTNLVMLLIAMHGGSEPPVPALRYAVASQAVNRRPPMKANGRRQRETGFGENVGKQVPPAVGGSVG